MNKSINIDIYNWFNQYFLPSAPLKDWSEDAKKIEAHEIEKRKEEFNRLKNNPLPKRELSETEKKELNSFYWSRSFLNASKEEQENYMRMHWSKVAMHDSMFLPRDVKVKRTFYEYVPAKDDSKLQNQTLSI